MIIIVYYLCLVRKKRPKEIKIEESTEKKCGALKWKLEIKYFGVTLFEMPNVFLTSNISVEQEPKKTHEWNKVENYGIFAVTLNEDPQPLYHYCGISNRMLTKFCAHNHRQSHRLNICQVNTNFAI